MNWINTITPENFKNSFDLKEILKNSTFYPASGIDFNNIEKLLKYTNSFVHVDYSISEDKIEEALRSDIRHHGFELIGLKRIEKNELFPLDFTPNNFPLKQEEDILKRNQTTNYNNRFCFWAIYELDIDEQFSVLHIGGEACEAFDFLYVNNNINPRVVTIVNPGEGYADNWTKFTDSEYRLFGLMQLNSEKIDTNLPEYVFTNMTLNGKCFWPNYKLIDSQTIYRTDLSGEEEYFTYQIND